MGDYTAIGRTCALGQMTEAYLETHVRFLQDPEVTRYLRIRETATVERQRTWVRRTLGSPSHELLAIFATGEGDRFVGLAQLREIDRVDGTAHSGMLIGDRGYWGRGIATEAKLLQLRHAFDDIGLRWIYSRTVSCNLRAQRFLEGTGYREQGLRPQSRLIDGVYHDEILYGVSRETWEPFWNIHCSASG